VNVLSVDLESWVHKDFQDINTNLKMEKDANYVCEATMDIIEILSRHNVHTTFFVISEVYDWYPWLIHKIKSRGHEICFHTHSHRKLFKKADLLRELKLGSGFIEEFDTKGFRAPEAFFREEYYAILKDWGFLYDSSIYSEFRIFSPMDGILEVPISTYPLTKKEAPIYYPRNLDFRLLSREIPFGSGFFFGLLGSNVGWFINRLNADNIPANLFIHPWQIRDFPRDYGREKDDVVHRIKMIPYNINRRNALEKILSRFPFLPMTRVINNFGYDTEQPIFDNEGETTGEKS